MLHPTYTIGGGTLAIQPGPGAEVTSSEGQGFRAENARLGYLEETHLRINDPIGTTIRVALPTTGFRSPQLALQTRRSGQGAGLQEFRYSIDGEQFQAFQTIAVDNADPVVHQFDFSNVDGGADNPEFTVEIRIYQGTGGSGGNIRFDNLTLEGIPLDGSAAPPGIAAPQILVQLIESAPATVFDIAEFFSASNGGALEWSVTADRDIVQCTSSDDTLHLQGIGRGETYLTLHAGNGVHPPIPFRVRILVHPSAHPLSQMDFYFAHWDPNAPEHHYPEHMLFLHSDRDDPRLDDPLDYAYQVPHTDTASGDTPGFPYNNSSRNRITGLGSRGISFINTGRGRDVGGALLALDTRNTDGARLHWTAGTETPNNRVYAIRRAIISRTPTLLKSGIRFVKYSFRRTLRA